MAYIHKLFRQNSSACTNLKLFTQKTALSVKHFHRKGCFKKPFLHLFRPLPQGAEASPLNAGIGLPGSKRLVILRA